MGCFTNTRIANVVENKKITLAHNPNFVTFSTKENRKVPIKINLTVGTTYAGGEEFSEAATFSIIEISTGIKHTFRGTNSKENINSNTYLLNSDRAVTAENIRIVMMKDSWLKNNFEITIPFRVNGTNITNGYTIYMTSKGAGEQFTFKFEGLNNTFLTLSGNPSSSTNSDTIDGGKGNTEIELDLYTDTDVFLGVKDIPSEADFGTFVTTLSKHYYQDSLWFETNTLISKKIGYKTDFLTSSDWVDAGTCSDYRYIAKTYNGETRIPFYISNVLYVLNGYDYTLNENDLTDYVYDTLYPIIIKPLTNAPDKNYVIGQTEYFNFILSDTQHNINISPEFNFGLTYKFNGGKLAKDPNIAALMFLRTFETISPLLEKYQKETEKISKDIPTLQEVVGETWKKEDLLKQLKSDLDTLDRKIQLSLKPIKQKEDSAEGENLSISSTVPQQPMVTAQSPSLEPDAKPYVHKMPDFLSTPPEKKPPHINQPPVSFSIKDAMNSLGGKVIIGGIPKPGNKDDPDTASPTNKPTKGFKI